MPDTSLPFYIFIVYAHEDAKALVALKKKLAVLEHGDLAVWYDAEIIGGEDWDARIKANLKHADLILLLVSDDFFASRYIKSIELREALEREKQGEATVIPVILHDCLWNEHPELARLQALPDGGKPIFEKEHWDEPAKGFTNAARGIARALKNPETETRRARKHARQAREAEAERERKLENQRWNNPSTAKGSLQIDESKNWVDLPEMLRIPGGTFTMGNADKDAKLDEQPSHEVAVPDFQMAKCPTTLAQFRVFVNETGYQTDAEIGGFSCVLNAEGNEWVELEGANWRYDCEGKLRHENEYDHPVIHVSWNDAKAYCAWLSKKTGQTYRLPSEAEWEYAAGNGAKHTKYSWGNDAPSGKRGGNVADETLKKRFPNRVIFQGYNDGFVFTAPVGFFKPNDFGLYDMTGNVWEWCEDWYHNSYQGAPVDGSAWLLSPKEFKRVQRGGSWHSNPRNAWVVFRSCNSPDHRYFNAGFRLARTV